MNGSDNKNNSGHNYKINIIKPQEKEETININFNNQNLLSLSRSRNPRKKKSSIQEKMENSFCIKKYKNEHGAHGEKILKELHKSQTIKNIITHKSSSLMENKSMSVITNKINNIDAVPIEKSNSITKSDKKHSINYNININNTNTNEILNIIKFINNLYTNDKHLQKESPIKTFSIKSLPKINNDSNNYSSKKKLSIQYRLEIPKRKTFKSSNEIQHLNSFIKKDKTNLSNFLKPDQKYQKEKSIEFSEFEGDINLNKSYQSIFHNSKKLKKKKSKSKFNRDKKNSIKKEKKRQEFESIKNTIQSNETDKQNNKTIKSKKETLTIKSSDKNDHKEDKKEEQKINNDNNNNKKKRKFNFCNLFCCLNP